MKRLLNPSLMILSFTLITACTRIHTGSTAISPTVNQRGGGLTVALVNQTSINGTWTTNACTTDEKTKAVYTATISFLGQTMKTDTLVYGDTRCVDPLSEEIRISTFDVTTDGSRIEETLNSVTYKPVNSVMATLYNQQSFCGVTEWLAGTEQTFLNADFAKCAELAAKQFFHSVLYGNKDLYLDDCEGSADKDCTTVQYIKNN